MKFRKSFLLTFTLFLLPGASLSAQEAKAPPQTPSPPQLILMPFFKSLDLSKSQKAKLKELDEKTRSTFETQREAMQTAKREFDEAMDSDAGASVVRQRYEAFVWAHDAFMTTGFDQALGVREILSPKQRTKFAELRRKLMTRGMRQPKAEEVYEDD